MIFIYIVFVAISGRTAIPRDDSGKMTAG